MIACIFVTGSSDRLGRMASSLLIEQGHDVVLYARNEARGREALAAVQGTSGLLCADLASLDLKKRMAAEAAALGRFDAKIFNSSVGSAISTGSRLSTGSSMSLLSTRSGRLF